MLVHGGGVGGKQDSSLLTGPQLNGPQHSGPQHSGPQLTGPQLTGPQRLRAQRAAVLANLSAGIVGLVMTGQLMQLFVVDVLLWQPAMVALLLALLPLMQGVRYLFLPWLGAVSRRRLLVQAGWLRLFTVLVLACLPTAWLHPALYVALVLIFQAALHVGPGVAWQPLMRDITTVQDRTSFFAGMRFWFSLVTMLGGGLATVLIGETMQPWAYRVFLLLSAGMLLNHVFWLRQLPDPPLPATVGSSSWRRTFATARRSALFRRPLLVNALMVFLSMPLLPVYLRQYLDLSAQVVSAVVLVQMFGALFGYRLWGRLGDAIGYRPLLLGLLFLLAASMPLLFLLPPSSIAAWPEPAAMGGLAALMLWSLMQGALLHAGLGLAVTSMQHFAVARDDALEAMALFALAMAGLTALWSAILGWFLQSVVFPAAPQELVSGFLYADPMKWWLCLGVPAAAVLSAVAAWGLPNARSDADLGDFFHGVTQHPWRSMREGRRWFAEAEHERLRLAQLLGRFDNPLNTEPLLRLFDDPSFDVRVEAIRGAANHNPDRVAPALQVLLEDAEDQTIWEHAAWTLGELRWQQSVPRLIELLAPGHRTSVRSLAARALGKIGDQTAMSALRNLLHEPIDNGIHASAGRALLRLGATDCIDELFELLMHQKDRHERYELTAVLAEWLHLPSSWLLRADSHQRTYDYLVRHLSYRGERWLDQRREIISAFEAVDLSTIQRLLVAAPESNDLIEQALRRTVERLTSWGPIAVLATVFLLYREEAQQRAQEEAE